MKWQEVCEHPALRNLPFKIETDEHGDLIMSPAKIRHGFLQGRIGTLLAQLRNDGEVIQECAIATVNGTKVADVAWVTRSRFAEIVEDYEAHIAPKVCVEVLSRTNTVDEIDTKKALYFYRLSKNRLLKEKSIRSNNYIVAVQHVGNRVAVAGTDRRTGTGYCPRRVPSRQGGYFKRPCGSGPCAYLGIDSASSGD